MRDKPGETGTNFGVDMAKQRPLKMTECKLEREKFHMNALPLLIDVIYDAKKIKRLVGAPKENRGLSGDVDGTGSLGWYFNEKHMLVVDGVEVKVQTQLIVTIIGTKMKLAAEQKTPLKEESN